jgi:hypothetical protein
MIEREKVTRKNENPGPGTYAAEKVKLIVTSMDKA